MKPQPCSITDANEAVASVAYRLSENIAIYPITPSTSMAELCDEWSARQQPNLWGDTPLVIQMQSEAGAAGVLHGALTGGTLATTFTASQGLLLMIPNMYKIAGELTPFCMHVTARSIATHALSIFGDHSDVMACRGTGFALLGSNNAQEAQDLAAVAHAATLETRLPFLHFFDGFRTSHEINTYQPLDNDALAALIDPFCVSAHHLRGLTPDAPSIRGTAQNPDVFFQAREAANPYFDAAPEIINKVMERFAEITGRRYHLFDYYGAPDAKRIIIAMGSSIETCRLASDKLNAAGAKTGVLAVRLLRPFSLHHFIEALPPTVEKIAVLDRCKEPGASGEPLYLELSAALRQASQDGLMPGRREPVMVGGRYGLGSKEFTPAMVKAVYDHLIDARPRHGFTVGINDDVTGLSLETDEDFKVQLPDVYSAIFFGLGSDGTVGANKNTIKIIGQETENCAQAYFVYDSKKSGAMTVSHLRFGPRPIQAPFLIEQANFIGVHQWPFWGKYDLLKYAHTGATILLNAPLAAEKIWEKLPAAARQVIVEKRLRLYTVDAYAVAREAGMGGRINTIMQTCFFTISGVIDKELAIAKIKEAIEKSYSRKGREVVEKNFAAVDAAINNLHPVAVPDVTMLEEATRPAIPVTAPDFVQRVTAAMLAGEGDRLPVSAFPVDGTWPTATSHWEKRNIATEIPIWDADLCIQCGKCALVCPHASIRINAFPESTLEDAPEGFRSVPYKDRQAASGTRFTVQVAPEDCTGCKLCVNICPAIDKADPTRKSLNMEAQLPNLERERKHWNFFKELPLPDPASLGTTVRDTQLRQPLFEFSGACSGCGETPYIKLLTQLFGDRLMIGNATGCSSIYGGNLPTTPYTTNPEGRGPAWSNSLFEDNAEFTLGLRLAADQKAAMARRLVKLLAPQIGEDFARRLLTARQADELTLLAQRERVDELKRQLIKIDTPEAKRLHDLADFLVKKTVWAIGGDGWAYDIGFGGLDHILASGRNLNILVLDTEVYSNTGGQASKSTPMGAVAKFASGGKTTAKKDLGLIAMSYGHVYVASVALGASEHQLIKALQEAESFDGPSLIIAYSPCLAHGYNLLRGPAQQKLAVESGHWPLYRHDPRRIGQNGDHPLQLDSPTPKKALKDFVYNEVRFRSLLDSQPDRAETLMESSQQRAHRRRMAQESQAGKHTT